MKKALTIQTTEAIYSALLESDISALQSNLTAHKETLASKLSGLLPEKSQYLESIVIFQEALAKVKKFYFADVTVNDKVASKAASNKVVAALQAANKAISTRFNDERPVKFSSHKTQGIAWTYTTKKTASRTLFLSLVKSFPATMNGKAWKALYMAEHAEKLSLAARLAEEQKTRRLESIRLSAAQIEQVYCHVVDVASKRGLDAKTIVYTLFDTGNINDAVLEGVLQKIV